MKISRGAIQQGIHGVDRPDPRSVPRFEGTVKQVPIGDGEGMSVSVVHFYDGARTYLHHHDGGQILVILAGRGQVGTAADTADDVVAGDVVHAAPGELHWHAAAPGHDMTHLSIAIGKSTWPGDAPPPRPSR